MIEEAQVHNICIISDFNPAPNTGLFGDIQLMCEECDLVIADVSTLPPGSFTHVNQGCLSQTWIDHVILSSCLMSVMTDCNILYNSVSSDHFPLTVNLNVAGLPALRQMRQTNNDKVK